jgi:FkbM family methyltransferase
MLRNKTNLQRAILSIIAFSTTIYFLNYLFITPEPKVVHFAKELPTCGSFRDKILLTEKLKKNKLTIRTTVTNPSFLFAGFDGFGGGANQAIFDQGVWAKAETGVFMMILEGRSPEDGIVMDVGANVGFFSLLSASMGFRVILFEPNPTPFMFIKLNIALNGLQNRITAKNLGLDKTAGSFHINDGADWATVSVAENGILVNTTTLRNEIHEDIVLLKIDVEGYEDNVLQRFDDILSKYTIENIILEVKKSRDYNFKRNFMNRLIKYHNYVLILYHEIGWATREGTIQTFDTLRCIKVESLAEDQWIELEDTWFIKVGSPTYEKVKKNLKCAQI